DAVLPDLPEGRLGHRDPGGKRRHARDAGPARRRPRAEGRVRRGPRGLPPPPRRGRPRDRRRAPARGHAERGRHAHPRQAPARPHRPRDGGARRQPVRPRGAGGAPRVVALRPLRRRGRRRSRERPAGRGPKNRGGGPVTRVAAVDCGTNSVRLLIADIVPGEGGGTLTDVERRMEIVRLGEGVDETGRLSPAALERTFTAMRGYADLIERHGARAGKGPIKTRVVATSATRDAENRSDFVNGVVDIFGVVPEVISGDEEAELSFTGATRELAALRPARPYLVVDIGGGSTEFVLGSSSADAAYSTDIGCVRMTERHL